jgi:hypothetical protein
MANTKKAGVVNLGCIPTGEYYTQFLQNLQDTADPAVWNVLANTETREGLYYKDPDLVAVASDYDALVLSPGDAKIGLRTPEREAEVGVLYDLIDIAVEKGIPVFGSVAGYQAILSSRGLTLVKLEGDKKTAFQREFQLDLSDQGDRIAHIDEPLTVKLGSSYAFGEKAVEGVEHLVDHHGFPILSRVVSHDPEAPIYGCQANIDLVKPVVANWFKVAQNI